MDSKSCDPRKNLQTYVYNKDPMKNNAWPYQKLYSFLSLSLPSPHFPCLPYIHKRLRGMSSGSRSFMQAVSDITLLSDFGPGFIPLSYKQALFSSSPLNSLLLCSRTSPHAIEDKRVIG